MIVEFGGNSLFIALSCSDQLLSRPTPFATQC
jgi:hypothetical protein